MTNSRGSSRPRKRTLVSYVSCIGRWVLYYLCYLRSQRYNVKRDKYSSFSQLIKGTFQVKKTTSATYYSENYSAFNISLCLCSVMSDSLWPMDCSLPGSSVHDIFQAEILGWAAISYSSGSFWSRDWTNASCISCISRQILLPVSHQGNP